MQRKSLHFVQSLAKGLTVLQAFSPARPALRLSEIAAITRLNLAATQRFTDTLVQMGFLQRNRHREFLLGSKALALGFAYLNGNQLRRLARKEIEAFGRAHRQSVNLGVLDDDHVVFLCRYESQRFLKFDLSAGSRLPCHCTATGKVLLAGLPDDELRQVLEGMYLERMTSHTICDADRLWEDLMATRRRGVSVCDREFTLAMMTIGAPVLDQTGRVTAAVNMSLSVEEAQEPYLADITEELLDLGRDISKALGYLGPYPLIAPQLIED